MAGLSRRELQALAKKHGIKANMKSEDILSALTSSGLLDNVSNQDDQAAIDAASANSQVSSASPSAGQQSASSPKSRRSSARTPRRSSVRTPGTGKRQVQTPRKSEKFAEAAPRASEVNRKSHSSKELVANGVPSGKKSKLSPSISKHRESSSRSQCLKPRHSSQKRKADESVDERSSKRRRTSQPEVKSRAAAKTTVSTTISGGKEKNLPGESQAVKAKHPAVKDFDRIHQRQFEKMRSIASSKAADVSKTTVKVNRKSSVTETKASSTASKPPQLGVKSPSRTGYKPPSPFMIKKSLKPLTTAIPFKLSQAREASQRSSQKVDETLKKATTPRKSLTRNIKTFSADAKMQSASKHRQIK
ncbi:hypothetical protein GUITHDRAFT_133013 [Guillardia theta CCMP2712]|uniref:Uncharacterized protein n=1 Tax=Guillardia theta (strain CCMP2712) TaxID=905079 RepID=L1JY56_GUITC|nr:hypothetical protein GUITHDRAFT_133013 [Guillardia theta CCMP2712]EKX53267.1 hypothetical protein GUITHDRAFT_133013 [Guillardia theta CCMP2712]|eukprot:XP_005840247.1 hypothetical protein GUITHDRAFT_133013 [Guillardia theta CCMP2712]